MAWFSSHPPMEARIARLRLGSRVTLAGAMSNVESLRLIREAMLRELDVPWSRASRWFFIIRRGCS